METYNVWQVTSKQPNGKMIFELGLLSGDATHDQTRILIKFARFLEKNYPSVRVEEVPKPNDEKVRMILVFSEKQEPLCLEGPDDPDDFE